MPTVSDSDIPIQITADGLIALRADRCLMDKAGLRDPFASWFLTEDGERLAEFAMQTDPVYAVFNLVRYRWFSEALASGAQRFPQIVVLGAGYDTRDIHMDILKKGTTRVFEVDVPATLQTRRRVLEANGVEMPGWVVQVPCDIGVDKLDERLEEAGFAEDLPSFVMAEGLFYYLSAGTIRGLVSRSDLHLGPGSVVRFDFWDDARIRRLNDRVFEQRRIRLFKPFPFPQAGEDLRAALVREGYESVRVLSLDALARQYWPSPHDWTEGGGWMLVEATCGSSG